MARWASLQEMATALGLQAVADDRDALRREVRVRLAQVHPDKTGGEFASAEQEERFDVLQEAMGLCNGQSGSSAVIPIQEIPRLVAALRDLLPAPREEKQVVGAGSSSAQLRLDVHERFVLPRISSAVFAAVSGALVLFSEKLKDNPVFGVLAQYSSTRWVMVLLFVLSGLLFVGTWFLEQRTQRQVQAMMTESGLVEFMEHLRYSHRVDKIEAVDKPVLRFSVIQLADAVRLAIRQFDGMRPSFWHLLGLGRPRLSRLVIEKVARFHLEDLLERGVVRPVTTKTLVALYEIDADQLRGASA